MSTTTIIYTIVTIATFFTPIAIWRAFGKYSIRIAILNKNLEHLAAYNQAMLEENGTLSGKLAEMERLVFRYGKLIVYAGGLCALCCGILITIIYIFKARAEDLKAEIRYLEDAYSDMAGIFSDENLRANSLSRQLDDLTISSARVQSAHTALLSREIALMGTISRLEEQHSTSASVMTSEIQEKIDEYTLELRKLKSEVGQREELIRALRSENEMLMLRVKSVERSVGIDSGLKSHLESAAKDERPSVEDKLQLEAATQEAKLFAFLHSGEADVTVEFGEEPSHEETERMSVSKARALKAGRRGVKTYATLQAHADSVHWNAQLVKGLTDGKAEMVPLPASVDGTETDSSVDFDIKDDCAVVRVRGAVQFISEVMPRPIDDSSSSSESTVRRLPDDVVREAKGMMHKNNIPYVNSAVDAFVDRVWQMRVKIESIQTQQQTGQAFLDVNDALDGVIKSFGRTTAGKQNLKAATPQGALIFKHSTREDNVSVLESRTCLAAVLEFAVPELLPINDVAVWGRFSTMKEFCEYKTGNLIRSYLQGVQGGLEIFVGRASRLAGSDMHVDVYNWLDPMQPRDKNLRASGKMGASRIRLRDLMNKTWYKRILLAHTTRVVEPTVVGADFLGDGLSLAGEGVSLFEYANTTPHDTGNTSVSYDGQSRIAQFTSEFMLDDEKNVATAMVSLGNVNAAHRLAYRAAAKPRSENVVTVDFAKNGLSMLGWVQTPELRAHFSQIVTRANEMMDGEGSLEPIVMRVCAGLLAAELGMLDQRAGDVVGGGLNSVRVAERALAGPRNLYRRTRQAIAEQRDQEGGLRVAGAPKVIYEHEAHPVLITSRNVHTSNWGVRNLNQPQAVNFNFSLSGSAGLTYTDMVLLCANREDWTLTDAQLGEALLLLGNIHQEHLGVSFRNHHEGVGPALLRMFGESSPVSVILSGRDYGYGGAFGRPSTDIAQNRFGVAAWVNDAAAEPALWQSNAGQEWLAGEVEIDANGVPTDGIAGNAARHTGLLATYARNTSLPSNAARANVGLMNVYANPAAWANLAVLMEHFGADDEMFERCFARLSVLATGCFSNSAMSLPTPIHERLYPYYLGMDDNILQEAAVVDWYNRLSRRMVYLYSSRFLLEDEVQAIRGEPIAGAPLNAHINYCSVVTAAGTGCDDENLTMLARDARRRVLGGHYFGTCGNHEHHVPKIGADGEQMAYDESNCEAAVPRRPDVPAIPAVYFDGMPLHSIYSVLDRNGEMKNDVDANDALIAVQATRLLHANDQAVRDVPVNLTEAYRDAIYQRRGEIAELSADLDGLQGQRAHRGLADYAFMRRFINVKFRRCATLEEVMASELMIEISKMSFVEQYVLAFYVADKMSVVGGGAVAMTLTAALGLQPGRPLSVAVGPNLQPPVSALRGGVVNSKLTAPVGFCAYRNLNEPVAAGIDRFLTLLSSGVASIPAGSRRLKTAIGRPDFRERLTRGWLLECFRACAAQDIVARSHKLSVVTIMNELGYSGTDNVAFNTEADMREQLVESGSLVGMVTKLRQEVLARYNSLSKLPDVVESAVGSTLLPALDAFGVVSNNNMIIWRSMHPIVRSVFAPVAATAVLPGGGVDQLRSLLNASARSIMANFTTGAGVSMVTLLGKLNVCLNMCGMEIKGRVLRRYANIHNPSDIDEYEMLQFWTRCGAYFDHALTVGGSLLSHGYFDAIVSAKDVVVENTREMSTMGVTFGQPAAMTPSSVRSTAILDLMETNRAQLGLLPRVTEHSRYQYGNPAIHSRKTDTYSRLQRSQIARVFGKMEARQTMRWDANVRVMLTGMRRWHCIDEANELFDPVESDGWAVWNPWGTAPGTLSRCQINQDTGAPTAIDLALNSLRVVAPFYSRQVESVASPYRATIQTQAMMRGPDAELLSADL